MLDDHSKVVDENGEPMVVYHGTPDNFTAFDEGKIAERSDGVRGFFFAPPSRRNSTAGYYAYRTNGQGNIMPLFLNIRKPLMRTTDEQVLPEVGADGIITVASEGWTMDYYDYESRGVKQEEMKAGDIVEIVAFSPNQVKSATDNYGGFSREDNDIRHRQGDGTTGQQAASVGGMVEKVQELAEKLHLDNVEIVTDTSTLENFVFETDSMEEMVG